MCFILLLHKLETPETIEQTIYEHLDVFVEEWKKQFAKEFDKEVIDVYIEEKIYILSPGTSTEKYIKHYLNFNKRENEPSLLKK